MADDISAMSTEQLHNAIADEIQSMDDAALKELLQAIRGDADQMAEESPGRGGQSASVRDANKPTGQHDDEAKLVEKHYERFAEEYGKAGLTKAKMVNAFKAERKLNPELTASEFTGVVPANKFSERMTRRGRGVLCDFSERT